MATRLILIRHGSTKHNAEKRYCGVLDAPLSSVGKAEIRCLGKRLKKEKVDKVYSSDRRRAIQSARILFKGRQIVKMPELKEISFGVFEGLTHAEILERHEEIYTKWLKKPYTVKIPRGEEFTAFKKRIIRALRSIIAANRGKTVAVVCHGGVISAYITHILRSRDFWKHIPGSASITVIDHKERSATIRLKGDTSHLAHG